MLFRRMPITPIVRAACGIVCSMLNTETKMMALKKIVNARHLLSSGGFLEFLLGGYRFHVLQFLSSAAPRTLAKPNFSRHLLNTLLLRYKRVAHLDIGAVHLGRRSLRSWFSH